MGKDGSHVNDGRREKDSSYDSHPILPPRGDYQTLLSFQKAEVVYNLTVRFAHKFLSRGDRTVDQMIQSARSGKKNILEGSKAALTSKDYLHARDLKIWDKNSKQALFVRELGRKTPQTCDDYREFVDTRPPEESANIAICLIHQTNYLIDQQLRRLEQDFLKEGGLRERMTRARLQARNGRHVNCGRNEEDGRL